MCFENIRWKMISMADMEAIYLLTNSSMTLLVILKHFHPSISERSTAPCLL